MTQDTAGVVREDLGAAVAAIGPPPQGQGVDGGRGLARIAARGAAWSLAATIGGRLVSLLSLVVLARLLSPADFGLVAFALVYITYLETVADLGTGAALIWWRGHRDDAAQAAFVLNAGMGLVWVALTMAAAPYVAAFFRTPAGEPVLRALSWVFLLKALGSTHDALCQKELRFRARVVPELGSGTIKAVVAIGLAAAGFGAWSLVWGQLAGQAVWTALMWRVVPWGPRWRWPHGLLRPMLRYGRGIVSVNVLSAVVHHADLVVVGRLLGATALGVYQVAYKLPEAAITVLVWVTSRVLFPALSRLNADSAALGRGWLAAVRYTSLLTFPAAAGLAVCAAPVVRLVFGERWLAAAPVLAGLAVAAGLRSAGSNAGDVLKAAGRPGLLAALGVVKAIVLVPALVMAASRGPATVAWTLAAVTAFNAVLSVAVSSRLAAVSVGDYARAVGPAVGVSGCVGLAAWSALRFAPAWGLPAVVLGGMAAFLLGTRAFAPEALRGAVEAFGGGPAGPTGAARRAGRIVVGTDSRTLLDFATRELLVPHTRAERLVRALSPSAARALLLRRDGLQAEPPWMGAAVGVTSGLDPLCRAVEQRRWIINERMESGRAAGGLVMLFDSDSARPQAALKVRPAGGPLCREHETLMELHARLPPALAAVVPRPLGYRNEEGWEALLLKWYPGHSPYVEMQRLLRPARRAGVHLRAAARWLAEFHAATREQAPPRHDGDVPLAFGHGDYWPRNLLLQGDAVSAVLDWERSGRGRPVTDDVFQFMLTYALNFRWTGAGRATPEEAFRLGFLERGVVSSEIARFLRSYCTSMRLHPRLLGMLFERRLATLSEAAGLPAEMAAALRRRWATARWSVFES